MIKLPIGQANIKFSTLKPAKAQGAILLKGWKKQRTMTQDKTQFNAPTLCIILRKAG